MEVDRCVRMDSEEVPSLAEVDRCARVDSEEVPSRVEVHTPGDRGTVCAPCLQQPTQKEKRI